MENKSFLLHPPCLIYYLGDLPQYSEFINGNKKYIMWLQIERNCFQYNHAHRSANPIPRNGQTARERSAGRRTVGI